MDRKRRKTHRFSGSIFDCFLIKVNRHKNMLKHKKKYRCCTKIPLKFLKYNVIVYIGVILK